MVIERTPNKVEVDEAVSLCICEIASASSMNSPKKYINYLQFQVKGVVLAKRSKNE